MKTILYATDCTNNDITSLRYAYRFSCIMGADLHVLHVYNFPPVAFSNIKPSVLLKKRMHQEKTELVGKYCKTNLENEFNQKSITFHAIENHSVSEGIQYFSEILIPDLIVIGMKDSHSNRGYFSGNIANALLGTIETPLLIVPNRLVYNKISTIAYATDFEEADMVSLQKIVEIAKPFSALIEVVHVCKTLEDKVKKNMEEFKKELLQKISYSEIVFKTITSKNVKSGLLNVLQSEKINILAMLERPNAWSFPNIFRRDLVKDMEESLQIPLLVFNKHSIKLQNANATCKKDRIVFSFT